MSSNASSSKPDPHLVEQFLASIREQQNLPLALVAGVASSLICAVIWGLITSATGYQIGYMAIGVGFVVGIAVRFLGKGLDPVYGVIGGAFALIGCLLGNYFSIIMMVASEYGMGFFETLGEVPLAEIPAIMAEGFSIIDLLFYGIAVYEGYRFAFRKITEEELAPLVRQRQADPIEFGSEEPSQKEEKPSVDSTENRPPEA